LKAGPPGKKRLLSDKAIDAMQKQTTPIPNFKYQVVTAPKRGPE
jgi:hypothetical protein